MPNQKSKIVAFIQKFFYWLLISVPGYLKNFKFQISNFEINSNDRILKHSEIQNSRLFRNSKFIIRNYYKPIIAVLISVIIGYLIYARVQYNQRNPYGVWETMVILRSQESGGSPEEDAKNSLKRGDVIAVQPEHHAWSETEYKSYLLVKIEGRKDDVEKLLEPLTRTLSVPDGTSPPLKGGEGNGMETIRARKYAVDMDKVGFNGEQVISGQPVEEKVFKVDIIKGK